MSILDNIIEIFPIQDWIDLALLSDNEMDQFATEQAEITDSITVPNQMSVLC